MKKTRILAVILLTILIFSIAFYFAIYVNNNYKMVLIIWLIAAVVFRIVVTPIIVGGVSAYNRKKLESEQENYDSPESKEEKTK